MITAEMELQSRAFRGIVELCDNLQLRRNNS